MCAEVFCAVMLAAQFASASEGPSPLALLQGVEKARIGANEPVRVKLVVWEKANDTETTCNIELDGAKRRFEMLPVPKVQFPGSVLLLDGDEVTYFKRAGRSSVELYDTKYAVGVRGDLAFDPRIIGLSDMMAVTETVKACLWYDRAKSMKLVGKEQLNGVPVWRVSVTQPGPAESELWIEQPSFRVHRVTVKFFDTHVEIDSDYDHLDSKSVFPKRVHIKRVDRTQSLERKITVEKFERPASIPAERFTLKSMDLPFAMPIVDYRLHLRIGYWAGDGIWRGETPPPLPHPSGAKASAK